MNDTGLLRVAPVLCLVNGGCRDDTAMEKIAIQVPSREPRSVGTLDLHAGIVFGMSNSIFGVELVPFALHSLILLLSMIHSPLDNLLWFFTE